MKIKIKFIIFYNFNITNKKYNFNLLIKIQYFVISLFFNCFS